MVGKKAVDLTLEEKHEIMELAKELGYKPKKRRMKTSRKLLYIFAAWGLILQLYVLVMVWMLRDTMSLGIITGVAFAEMVVIYLGYLRYQYGINLKSMEMNYDPHYDDNQGVY